MQGSKNSFFSKMEKRAKFDDLKWSEQSSSESKKIDNNKEERRKFHRNHLDEIFYQKNI